MFQKLIDSSCYDALLVMVHPWYPWMPPLGLAYVSTYLRNKGYKPLVYDFNAELYNKVSEEKRKFWDISTISEIPLNELVKILNEEFLEEINDFTEFLIDRPEPIIGFSVNYLNIIVTSKIAEKIKERSREKLIIFGGPGCFWEYNRKGIKRGSVDIFVIGEGEKVFYEIVDRFYKGKNISDIKGTVFIFGNEERNNTPPEPILNLDEIPFPTFEEFELKNYGCGDRIQTLPLLISRGCISKCSFCVDYIMCNPFRIRSPENVVAEIEYHINVNKIRNFSFNDLLCNGHLGKLEKLCELIIERGLKIQWGSYAIARGDMNLELLKKMKKAGCVSICYGIESGSNSVLKAMNKLYTAEDAEKVLRFTYEAGIRPTFNIIVGHPGEGKKEFKETLLFIKKNRKYIYSIINVSTLFVNPTSHLGSEPSRFGLYFPKNPSSFRFFALKKILIPKYYKIFGQSLPVMQLKGVDLSEFIAPPGNTKTQRLKRLVKILKFINRLGLFKEDPIINVYPTKNRKIKKNIKIIKKKWEIGEKSFFLISNYRGHARLFYNNKNLTSEQGFVTAFKIDNQWYESSKYNWEIEKSTPQRLKISIFMTDLNLRQYWKLKIGRKNLSWEIKICSDRDIKLEELKIGLILNKDYSYWSTGKFRGGLFKALEEKWSNIPLEKLKNRRILINPLNKKLPSIYCSRSKIGFFQMELPDGNRLNGKFLHTILKNISLAGIYPLKFRYLFQFKK